MANLRGNKTLRIYTVILNQAYSQRKKLEEGDPKAEEQMVSS
jgi:hypothetical protein